MEKAIIVDEMKWLNKAKEFDRVYLGNEFCQYRIPAKAYLKNMISSAGAIPFSLITPIVTSYGLKKLLPIFDFLKEQFAHCEIIVNDFGVLGLLSEKYKGFKIIIGRLLSPFTFSQANSILQKFGLGSFLKQYKIKRVEIDIDNLNIIKDRSIDADLSLYYPYALLSTTRLCKIGLPGPAKKGFCFRCKKECVGKTFEIENPQIGGKIILKGNTYFLRRETPLRIRDGIISRIIFQPILDSDEQKICLYKK
ncbi:MAG: hypothetical protein D4S01_04015 [Dehalococcoidia bacterium]|nr:MAG: hypothetical protein D4S01_04015 [Dehalococcoidia bacterium]